MLKAQLAVDDLAVLAGERIAPERQLTKPSKA
jgi:hypothetical protein